MNSLLLAFCAKSWEVQLMLLIKIFFKLVCYIVPPIIIIASVIGFTKPVTSGKEEDLKDNGKLLVKRIIAGLLIMFIPTIISYVFTDVINGSGNQLIACMESATKEKVAALKAKEDAAEEAAKKAQEKEDQKKLKENYEKDQKQREKQKKLFEEEKRKREAKQATPETEIQRSGDANIYFLNTGSSDSIILESQGHFGIIDTSVPEKASYIISYLSRLGVKELDFVLLTHAHNDHIGGFNSIASRYRINNFFMKAGGLDYGVYKSTYKRLINKAKQAGATFHDTVLTNSYTLGDINLYFYNRKQITFEGITSDNLGRSENCNSTTTVGTISGLRIYFAGDIGNYFGFNCESNTAQMVGHVDIYKVAHHGYTTFNNHEDAIRALSPSYAVITNATNNGYGTAVRRIKSSSINPNFRALYVTGNGTVTLSVQKDGTFRFTQ